MIFLFLMPYKFRLMMSYLFMDLYLNTSSTRCFILPKSYFTTLNEVYFLGEYFPIPKYYEKVLVCRYGPNWTTPIPPSEWNKIWKNKDNSISFKKLSDIKINHNYDVF